MSHALLPEDLCAYQDLSLTALERAKSRDGPRAELFARPVDLGHGAGCARSAPTCADLGAGCHGACGNDVLIDPPTPTEETTP